MMELTTAQSEAKTTNKTVHAFDEFTEVSTAGAEKKLSDRGGRPAGMIFALLSVDGYVFSKSIRHNGAFTFKFPSETRLESFSDLFANVYESFRLRELIDGDPSSHNGIEFGEFCRYKNIKSDRKAALVLPFVVHTDLSALSDPINRTSNRDGFEWNRLDVVKDSARRIGNSSLDSLGIHPSSLEIDSAYFALSL